MHCYYVFFMQSDTEDHEFKDVGTKFPDPENDSGGL